MSALYRCWLFRGLLVAVFLGGGATNGYALFLRPDLKKVPVVQLAENLERLAEQQPENAALRVNLARLHAMAFALKTDTAEVARGREKQGAWFGFTPKFVPFDVKPAKSDEQRAAAKQQLAKAIDYYQQAIKLDPKNLTAQLGYGWALQQAGQKEKAIAQLRQTIEQGWEKEKDKQVGGLGGHFITSEAASYLIPLLNAQDDQEEIAELEKRIARLQKLPRPVTPIIVPLADDTPLSQLVAPDARVMFDADGTGRRARWSWITPQAAWLVYDARGTGQINSALQMFGSVSFWLFWDNGYQALAALDDNADGQLSGNELQHLSLWHDRNCNGISEPGEVQPVAQHGIVAINCRGQASRHPVATAQSTEGVRFATGQTRPTYDLILRGEPAPLRAASSE